MTRVEPLTASEVAAMRRWHRRRKRRGRWLLAVPRFDVCEQGDPWPCRNARWLATLDAALAATPEMEEES